MARKYQHCANCGEDLEDEFYYFSDNYLQIKYFDEPDGSDNAFCSKECACQALMLTSQENTAH